MIANPPENKVLSNSEERYRALVTATSDVVYRMGADWGVMLQLDGGSFLVDTAGADSNWLNKYIHPDDQELVKAAFAKAIGEKSIFQLEHRVLRADGTLGWTFSRAVPIFNNEGEIMEWFGAANDVTARKQTEDDLKQARDAAEQQKRQYETITSSTPDLIYVFSLDYKFEYANQALLNMWGKTWDTAVGKGLRENGYEEWHALMHEREIDEVREKKISIRGEVHFPHATQGRRMYDYILNPVFNAQGDVIAVAGTTRDITDIRNAESEISESEARFRTMAEGTDVMIAVSDETGNAIYFNEAWTKATGRNVNELTQNGWIDLMHPDDKERVTKFFADVLNEKKTFQWDFRMPDGKGSYLWLLARGVPRFRTDGSFAGYISSTVDITEIKENEQRKNDFISMVSHELKTPLTSVMSYVQVTQKRAVQNNDEVSAGMLERAGKQLDKMTRMINGFLNVSRLESGRIQIDHQPFDLALLLKELEDEAKATVFSHTVLFAPAEEIWLNADREKISQVFNNLISNAVKYSPAGTTVHVGCAIVGDDVQISIKDEGIGISKTDLPKLFERYYRVQEAEISHISGFGIGLYLCSEIIKLHGGQIWAESTPGNGSAFFFKLPRMQK